MRGVLLMVFICGSALAQETASLRLTLQGGAVVGVENRLTGEVLTRPASSGDQTSALRVTTSSGVMSERRDGEEGARLDSVVNAAGTDLVVQQTATCAEGGVAGVWLGVGPLEAKTVQLLIPGVGGVRLDQDSTVADQTYYYPGAWGTPAVALQGSKGGVLITADDPANSFKALRVTRLAAAWRLLFLTDAAPPYQTRTTCASARWRFAAYEGPWTVAAELQRERVRQAFDLTPLAQRQPEWLPRIRCMVRVVGQGPCKAPLKALARQVDPAKTLLYLPHWRSHPYDCMYPDYTPSADALEFIRFAHSLGFRVMVHGNLVGISPFHPRMDEFRDAIECDPVTRQPVGWWLDRDTQAKIFCLNPAYAKVRQLLVEAFIASHRQMSFDALHLDFPLIINDASGPVEGRNSIQGTVALLKELQMALPAVALGTEGISDYMLACSFAQLGEPFWNNHESQGRYHPFRAGIFSEFCNVYGHLGIPDQQTDLQAYLSFTEVHDRVGSLPTFTLDRDRGLDMTNPGTRFALRQARYFITTEPVPDFTATCKPIAAPGDPPAQPYFAWRQADGRGLAVVQTPSGRKWLTGGPRWRELWRIYQNITRLPAGQHLPGWLAYDEAGTFGLDPSAIYLPEPGHPDPAAFHLTGADLPVRVTLCGSDTRRDLIRIEAAETQVKDLLALRPDVAGLHVDGEDWPLGRGGSFQLQETTCGGVTRRGLFAHPPWQFPELPAINTPRQVNSFGEYHLRLPTADDLCFSAYLGLGDHSEPNGPAGDGVTFRVLVNGNEVFSQHHGERRWKAMKVDLSSWRGQEVVLRLLTNPGPAGQPEFDWAVWGEPRIMSEAAAREATLEFVPPPQGGVILVANATGTHRVLRGTRQVRSHLPATLLSLRDLTPITGPCLLAALPHGVTLVSGGIMSPGSLYGAGDPGTWTDGTQTRIGLNGHPPAWGQTHLEWALQLPATPLQLDFGAGINKGGEPVSFKVLLNGLPVWNCGWPGAGRVTAGSVNLSPWAGQAVLLSLVTDSEGSNNCDWAIWCEPRLREKGE